MGGMVGEVGRPMRRRRPGMPGLVVCGRAGCHRRGLERVEHAMGVGVIERREWPRMGERMKARACLAHGPVSRSLPLGDLSSDVSSRQDP